MSGKDVKVCHNSIIDTIVSRTYARMHYAHPRACVIICLSRVRNISQRCVVRAAGPGAYSRQLEQQKTLFVMLKFNSISHCLSKLIFRGDDADAGSRRARV